MQVAGQTILDLRFAILDWSNPQGDKAYRLLIFDLFRPLGSEHIAKTFNPKSKIKNQKLAVERSTSLQLSKKMRKSEGWVAPLLVSGV